MYVHPLQTIIYITELMNWITTRTKYETCRQERSAWHIPLKAFLKNDNKISRLQRKKLSSVENNQRVIFDDVLGNNDDQHYNFELYNEDTAYAIAETLFFL